MKITNRELLSKVNILQSISQKQLPVKVSYSIAKNISLINKELKIFEEEKLKIVKEFALKDDFGTPILDGVNFKFESEEKETECNSKYNELLDIENEINLREVDSMELFKSNCNFSPNELIELDFMIKE